MFLEKTFQVSVYRYKSKAPFNLTDSNRVQDFVQQSLHSNVLWTPIVVIFLILAAATNRNLNVMVILDGLSKILLERKSILYGSHVTPKCARFSG